MGNNLGELFLIGGWVMWPLLIFSIVSWAVIIERTYVYLTLRPRLQKLGRSLQQSLEAGDPTAARLACQNEKPMVGDVYLAVIDREKSREYVERITERKRAQMVGYLKKNLWILGTIGSASPFVGLLGTVIGIVRAFGDMSKNQGAGGFSVVQQGISEALIATAAGLIVAIVALLMYNVFVTIANQTLTNLKLSIGELLDLNFEKAR